MRYDIVGDVIINKLYTIEVEAETEEEAKVIAIDKFTDTFRSDIMRKETKFNVRLTVAKNIEMKNNHE